MQSTPVNILVVDDQPAKLMSYEAVLDGLGENLIKAASAREALELLLKNDVAVILVDVCMPELDGFQLAEMIRGHPRYQSTAIVFISAVQLDDLDRLRGYRLGAVDYVPVPIIPELLRAKVKVFAELYRKTRQLEQLNQQLEQRVAERTMELEATNARLKLAIEAAQLGMWDWDVESGRVDWSNHYFTLAGYRPTEIGPSIDDWLERLHPDDASAAREQLQAALRSGEPYRQVVRFMQPDGTTLWCEARGQSETDARGQIRRMRGVLLDISSHKMAEERQRLMLRELHHRVNNSLATIQAIAGLTARTVPDVDTFYRSFSERIQSLSRTHTMLVAENWRRIALRDLLQSEMASFADGRQERLTCSGPPVDLPSALALSLGLVIHELTTNAAKYGALSTPSGRIEVTWELEDGRSRPSNLDLRWVERGGPPVSQPERKGFGTTLLNQVFANQADTKVDLVFGKEGLEFRAWIAYDVAVL